MEPLRDVPECNGDSSGVAWVISQPELLRGPCPESKFTSNLRMKKRLGDVSDFDCEMDIGASLSISERAVSQDAGVGSHNPVRTVHALFKTIF